MWQHLTLVALAGSAGTLARYGLHTLVHRFSSTGFPFGTLTVNALGCFLFGIIWPLAEQKLALSPQARAVLLVGFLGSFTTFSTFAADTGRLAEQGSWGLAAANVAANNALGISLFFAGLALGRAL